MNFLHSEIGAEPVIVEGTLRGSLERVYRAWTDPEEIVKWFGLKSGAVLCAEIDLRVGGRWCFVMQDDEDGRACLQGEYLEIETGSRLAFSWRYVREFADGRHESTPESKVTVRFRPDGKATHVHLRHEGIVREDGRLGVGQGWNASFQQLGDWLNASPDQE